MWSFLPICITIIILCICLRMIFRRRVLIMTSLPDHWHNSLSLLFFRQRQRQKKMREEDAWTIKWRARTHTYSYIIWSLSKKKGWWRVSSEHLEDVLLLCLFFCRYYFDQNLLRRLSTKKNRNKKRKIQLNKNKHRFLLMM